MPPPSNPVSIRWIAAAIAGVLSFSGLIWLLSDDQAPSPTATATEIAQQTPVSPATPTTGPIGSPTPTATPLVIPPCEDGCLVRIDIADQSDAADLAAAGFRTVYARESSLWGAADQSLIEQLAADSRIAAVVRPDEQTTSLYVVRFPQSIDVEAANSLGTIVDQSGQTVIVEVDTNPPYIADLVARGIAVEKVQPPESAPADRSDFPLLDDPMQLVSETNRTEIVQTINELVTMGGESGEPGSRLQSTLGNALAADYIFERFNQLGLDVRFNDYQTDDGYYATNVVAELIGEDPGQIFMIAAHFDTITNEGVISPGADDNGSGVASMIESARILSRFRLPYTIWFVALNGEEVGFQGAHAFVDQSFDVPIVAAFNLDSLGWPGRGSELVINGDASTIWIQNVIAGINDQYGFGQQLVIRQNENIVADDNILRQGGIPTVLIARTLFGDNDIHHGPNDLIENLDINQVGLASGLILVSIYTAMTVE